MTFRKKFFPLFFPLIWGVGSYAADAPLLDAILGSFTGEYFYQSNENQKNQSNPKNGDKVDIAFGKQDNEIHMTITLSAGHKEKCSFPIQKIKDYFMEHTQMPNEDENYQGVALVTDCSNDEDVYSLNHDLSDGFMYQFKFNNGKFQAFRMQYIDEDEEEWECTEIKNIAKIKKNAEGTWKRDWNF